MQAGSYHPEYPNSNPQSFQTHIQNYLAEKAPLEPVYRLVSIINQAYDMHQDIVRTYNDMAELPAKSQETEDWQRMKLRVSVIVQKNKNLMQRILDLRAAVIWKMQMSLSDANENITQEYELIKKEIIDQQNELQRYLEIQRMTIEHRLRQSEPQDPFIPISGSGFQYSQFKKIERSILRLTESCQKAKIEIQYIGKLMRNIPDLREKLVG